MASASDLLLVVHGSVAATRARGAVLAELAGRPALRLLLDRLDAPSTLDAATRLVLTGTVAIAAFGVVNAQEVMDLRYSAHTKESAPVFALLIACFVAVCSTYVFGTLLTAGGRLRQLNWMAAGGALLNVGINLVLIPRIQAEGAAWASLVTQVLTALAQIVLAARLYQATIPFGLWARAAAYALALVAVAIGLAFTGLSLVVQLLLFVAAALLLAYVLGLVNTRVVVEALELRLAERR